MGSRSGNKSPPPILASRVSDGSEIPEPHLGVDYFTSNLPGHWRQDPISQIPLALGAHWGACKTFVIKSTYPVPGAAAARHDQREIHHCL